MTGLVVLLVLLSTRAVKIISTPGNSRIFRFIHVSRSLISPSGAKFYRGLAFAFSSGVLSAHTLLLAKSAVELLVRTIVDHVNQFNRWQSWMILLGLVLLALTQLYYMHLGLKLCSTSVLYPFVFCIYNVVAILDGLIYFRQASQLTGLHAGLIAIGTVVLLAGVLCLSWRLEAQESHPSLVLPNTAQTPLGTGMEIVEEYIEPSENEDSVVGERQPLLAGASKSKSTTHQRAPSVPLIPTYRYRSNTVSAQNMNNESAQIWAELDDSEHEDDDRRRTSMESPSSSATLRRSIKRPQRRTFSLLPSETRRQRRPSLGNIESLSYFRSGSARDTRPPLEPLSTLSRWSPRQLQYKVGRSGSFRRTSASVSQAERSGSGQSASSKHMPPDARSRTYGTNSSTDGDETDFEAEEEPYAENLFKSGWKRGLGLVRRWAGWSRPNRDENSSGHAPV